MSLPTSNAGNAPVASRRGAPSSRRARPRFRRAGLAMATLLGTGMLATACGIVHSSEQVVGFPGHALGVPGHALAFVNCMRTHGEPNMPEPVVDGNSVHITIKVGSGVDPASPRFAAAFKACKYLTRAGKGDVPGGPTITPADQADYLKAVACLRTHGYPKFPDPQFQDDNVTFTTRTPIDTNTPQYQRALAACDKLIPAGLPYSGRHPSAS